MSDAPRSAGRPDEVGPQRDSGPDQAAAPALDPFRTSSDVAGPEAENPPAENAGEATGSVGDTSETDGDPEVVSGPEHEGGEPRVEPSQALGGGDDPDTADADLDVDDLPGGLRGALEAVLMVVEEPIDAATLASAMRRPVTDVERELQSLADDYDRGGRGFALLRVAGGWRVYSRSEYAPIVERFLLDGQRARLTQAALETLAVVAYRQPVSRARVSAVRGVNVDGVVRTLLTRGLITEVGVDDEHGAVLYGTTPYFLQRLGLASLDDLPPLAPYLPEIDMLDTLTDDLSDRSRS